MEEYKARFLELSQLLAEPAALYDLRGVLQIQSAKGSFAEEDLSVLRLLKEGKRVLTLKDLSYCVIDSDPMLILAIQGTSSLALLLAECLGTRCRKADVKQERQNFLKNVLLENELPGDIPLRARDFQIAFNERRQALLIRQQVADAAEGLACLEQDPELKDSIILQMDEESVVLLLPLEAEALALPEDLAERLLESLSERSRGPVYIGIGLPAQNLQETARSYREASLALTVGDIFYPTEKLMWYERLGLGRLIYQLPPTLCQMFLREVFQPDTYEALDNETLLTIDKFFENNLNGSETSRQLFVHRNTLVYRLDKVQKITGLDLRSFDDAVLFKLASMVRQYLESMQRTNRQAFLGRRYEH